MELKNIDKSNWKKYKFSDLVTNVNEKVIPCESGLEHYIGLKHLDAGSLKIRRFGETSSLIGNKLKIYKGDFILAKRNAYLKRVSIADFDAVASAHSFVLRTNQEHVLKEFMPFFLLSEYFWHRAIQISVGSLSPTINWKTLSKQEFILPPKDQQARLAELLWAMDEVIEKEKEVFEKIDILFKSKAKYISDNKVHYGEYTKLGDICDIKDNLRKPINSKNRKNMQGEIPYYGANGIVDKIDDFIFDEDLVLVAEDGGDFREFFDKEIAYRISGKSWVNNHAHVISPKKMTSTDWLFYSLVHKNILKYIIGSTRLKLNKSELERIPIWNPSDDIKDSLLKVMNQLFNTRKKQQKKIIHSQNLQKSIINQIF
tara:strand:- start:6213 stop:7325 length:1113 start_codon:yes stop_codon:yes gene_type:complete